MRVVQMALWNGVGTWRCRRHTVERVLGVFRRERRAIDTLVPPLPVGISLVSGIKVETFMKGYVNIENYVRKKSTG